MALEDFDEYRKIHARMSLSLSLKDLWAMLRGKKAILSLCMRVRLVRNDDGSLKTIDTDLHDANVIITKGDEGTYNNANFNTKSNQMHT